MFTFFRLYINRIQNHRFSISSLDNDPLQASLQDLRVAKNQLQANYEKLKADELEQEKCIKELSGLSEKREQAKSDLKGTFFVISEDYSSF